MTTEKAIAAEKVWTEAPHELRTATPPGQRRRWGDVYEALLKGKTVFIVDEYATRAQGAVRVYLSQSQPDKMLRIRTMVHNGERGLLMWIDDRPS